MNRETNDFYRACSIGDIPTVKSYLAQIPIDEINRLESNGNTALHAAAFYHNVGVVYLLLKQGAVSSIQNRYGRTPFEETTSLYIKQLLSSLGPAAWIEWTLTNPPTREMKQNFDSTLDSTFQKMGLPYILDYLLSHYIRRHVTQALPRSIQAIEKAFMDARASISIFPVIRAYTAEFGFDQIIHQHCIEILSGLLRTSIDPQNTLSTSIFYLIAALSFDPMLRPKYTFTGRVYRGLTMNADYIRTLKRNELVVNRIFISTFRNIQLANRSIGFDQSNQFRLTQSRDFLQAAVRITYQIHRPETRAVNITNMSAHSSKEEQILLMPMSVFRIIDIRSDTNGLHFDVILEDYELPAKDDPLAPIIRCDFAEFPDRPLFVANVQPSNEPVSNTSNRRSNNTTPRQRNRLVPAISRLSTRTIIIAVIVIIFVIILIVLAILLPILLRRRACNDDDVDDYDYDNIV